MTWHYKNGEIESGMKVRHCWQWLSVMKNGIWPYRHGTSNVMTQCRRNDERAFMALLYCASAYIKIAAASKAVQWRAVVFFTWAIVARHGSISRFSADHAGEEYWSAVAWHARVAWRQYHHQAKFSRMPFFAWLARPNDVRCAASSGGHAASLTHVAAASVCAAWRFLKCYYGGREKAGWPAAAIVSWAHHPSS